MRGDALARLAARYLEEVYLPRLEAALARLPGEAFHHQPHPGVPSPAMLVAHLAGNLGQWVLQGLGGRPYRRDRPAEFRRGGKEDREGLVTALRERLREAAAVLRELSPARLEEVLEIQGFRVTGREAVLHVVEHTSWHTGQLVWIAKLRAGPDHGIAFYDEESLARP